MPSHVVFTESWIVDSTRQISLGSERSLALRFFPMPVPDGRVEHVCTLQLCGVLDVRERYLIKIGGRWGVPFAAVGSCDTDGGRGVEKVEKTLFNHRV